MKQSRKGSLQEQLFKTVVKYVLAVAFVWPFAGWVTGIEYTASQNLAVMAIFTLWGIIIGYILDMYCVEHMVKIMAKG